MSIELQDSTSRANEPTPLSKIREAGAYEIREGKEDVKIIVLPSCVVPIEHLDPSGWDNPLQIGTFRSVLEIESVTGRKIEQALIAKSPERRLTLLRRYLEKGEIWWTGPRGIDRYAYKIFTGEQRVEDLGRWEAAFLTKLWQERIPAEEPQAILEYPNGCVNVIVKRVRTPRDGVEASELRGKSTVAPRDLCALANSIKLKPEDFQTCFDTELAEDRIIDTARWTWPPYTNDTHEKIRQLLLQQAQDA